MPKEIPTSDAFEELLKEATEVRIVRSGDSAKVKLRTRRALYTFKTTTEEADSLAKSAKVPVQEF